MITYQCWFYVGKGSQFCDIPSIGWAREGFWINLNGQFTVGSDCYKWIPPGAIMFVQKFEAGEKPNKNTEKTIYLVHSGYDAFGNAIFKGDELEWINERARKVIQIKVTLDKKTHIPKSAEVINAI